LNNKKTAYVGETVNAARRAEQHLANPDKKKLTEIRIISDSDFNKSVILDLESYLIKHMAADGKYTLLNGNNGIQDHDYYERSRYEDAFRAIWKQLKKKGVVDNTIEDIENSELFKYSPYKSLGTEQLEAEREILGAFAMHRNDEGGVRIIVRGGAGTGKTILAIYLMKLFSDISSKPDESPYIDDYLDEDTETVYAADNLSGIEKIGIVFPQSSLKASIKDVFRKVDSLKPKMVLGAVDVVKDYLKTKKKYDLLIVDEGHRLKCRRPGGKGNLANNGTFKKYCNELGLDYNNASELDWLTICSEHLIIFRDDWQTVRPSDMDADEFMSAIKRNWNGTLVEQYLLTQWRCNGGNEYIDYLKAIWSCKATRHLSIDNYDFKMYDDVDKMVEDIKKLNKEYGLCRSAAGYAWKWKSKKDKKAYDIIIDGNKYRWNSTLNNWIEKPYSINEIGCIHTVQGYDLNYVGVIIGEDVKYDPVNKRIIADKTNYYDTLGKSGVADDPEALKEYLVNIYRTLMTRGIRGTYVYVCDPELRKYMAKFIDKA
ncbi:MAG: DUF2075 domain-containing protein, partial [Mogibacterium sp.]|nr:DUF2075 domain-containing protein [Mogibacterium sp.]